MSSVPQSDPVMLPARSFGRVARSVAAHGVITGLIAGSPLLVFVPAAIFHCGIRNGRRAAWIAFAIAIALFAGQTSLVAMEPKSANEAWMFFAGITLAVALPALAAIPLVERATSFGRTLLALLSGAAIGLGATEMVLRSIRSFSSYAFIVASAQQVLKQVLAMYQDPKTPLLAIRIVQMMFDARVQPAIALAQIGLVFVLSLMMIGRLKAWREHVALRGNGEALGTYLFRNLVLPEWLLFAFLFGGITPLTKGLLQTIAANVLIVVVCLYILQGLAIFRSLLLAIGVGPAGTILGWMLLVFALASMVGWLLLAVAGLFDPFFHFRHFKRKDDSHESHTD
ncbi:MAG TPA: hypothetical protein VMU84_14650 [Thermoanaerobaculia bacterium]|nr:hypothetical protein [Thermoanaerobaculia bacterium]